ncbi:MAG: hydrogenase maturation protease [Thiobacillaceae bacterium]
MLAIGNPSRGDDALGPLLLEHLQAKRLADVELLTDFQLQVEHSLDLIGRQAVVFVDAAASGPAPFVFLPIGPRQDASHTSHALSPQALLHTYGRLYGAPPAAHVLAIRGYDFSLGAGLSERARDNLAAAEARLLEWLAADR